MKRLAAVTLILIAGCGERDEPLPNGYRFIELSRGNGAITKDGAFAVYPNIVEHRVRGSLVLGRRMLARDNADGSAPFTKGLGYFVFDTSTGRLLQGMPKSSSANGSHRQFRALDAKITNFASAGRRRETVHSGNAET